MQNLFDKIGAAARKIGAALDVHFHGRDGEIRDSFSDGVFPARAGLRGVISIITPTVHPGPCGNVIPVASRAKEVPEFVLRGEADGVPVRLLLTGRQFDMLRTDFFNQELEHGRVESFPDLSGLER